MKMVKKIFKEVMNIIIRGVFMVITVNLIVV